MFLTNMLLKKAKAKLIMVAIRSQISGHEYNTVRLRLGEKVEQMRFDPRLQMPCLYKEHRKIKSVRHRSY